MKTKFNEVVEWRGAGWYASRREGSNDELICTYKCGTEQMQNLLQSESGTAHFFATADEFNRANPQVVVIDHIGRGKLFAESTAAEIFLARHCKDRFPYGKIAAYWKDGDCPDIVFRLGKLIFYPDGGNGIAEYFPVTIYGALTPDEPVLIYIDGLLGYFNCIPQRLHFCWDKSSDYLPTED